MGDALRVLYHDDFDGAASAGLLTAVLRTRDLERDFAYAPIDYGMRLDWEGWPAQAAGAKRFAVVDFQYHPRATYWFDHHRTAFPTEADRAHYQARRSGREWPPEPLCHFDVTAPSCARLIHAKCAEVAHLGHVAAAADLIDQAAYPTVADYFNATRPEIGLSVAWWDLTEGEKAAVAGHLASGRLEQAALGLKAKVGAAVARNIEQLNAVAEHMELRGDVVLMDCHAAGLPFVRFASYFYYPEALYTLAVYASGPDIRIGLGKNPWLAFPHKDLGALAATSGGGGHAYAAGTIFRQSQHAVPAAAAWAWLTRAARWLNEPADAPLPLAA